MSHDLHMGDPVVYTAEKCSSRPGPRAHDVMPAPRGETYHYEVEKFWRVKDVLDDGRVRVYTRRGKEHILEGSDPRLKKAGLLARLLYRRRFPAPLRS